MTQFASIFQQGQMERATDDDFELDSTYSYSILSVKDCRSVVSLCTSPSLSHLAADGDRKSLCRSGDPVTRGYADAGSLSGLA